MDYTINLTRKYGYYDSFVSDSDPIPFIPNNPSDYINDFFLDQKKRQKQAYRLALIDPSLINALYGLVRYVAKGNTTYRPIMFKIKEVQFMPSILASRGTLGIENYFNVYFKANKLPAFNV